MSRDRSQAGEGQQAPGARGPRRTGRAPPCLGPGAPPRTQWLRHVFGFKPYNLPRRKERRSRLSPPSDGKVSDPGACEVIRQRVRARHSGRGDLPTAGDTRPRPPRRGRSAGSAGARKVPSGAPGPHAAASPLRPRLLRGAHLKPGPAWAPQGPGQLSGGGCPHPRGAACLGSVWTGLQAAPLPSVLRLCREAERRHASAEERGARAGAPSLGSLLRGRGQGRLGAAALAREGRRQVTCGDAAWARFRAWHARSPRASRPFLPSSPLSRCKHCGRSPHRRGGDGGCWGRP